jgi:hypothetical protein
MKFAKVRGITSEWLQAFSDWRAQNLQRSLIIVSLLLVVYSISLASTAFSTLALISDFHISDIAGGNGGIDKTVDIAIAKMDEVSESTAKTRRVAAPLLALCSLGRVISPLRDNCDAVNGLFDRFEHDENGAIELLNAAQSVNVLVSHLRDGDSASSDQSVSIETLRLNVSNFDESSAAARAIARPKDKYVLPQLVAGYDKAIAVEGDLSQLAGFVNAGIGVLESTQRLESIAGGAFEDLTSEGGSSARFDDISAALALVSPAVSQFQKDIETFEDSMPTYLQGSGIHDLVISLSSDAKLIVDLILGLSIPIEILDESLTEIRSTEGSLLTDGGLATMLDGLIEREQELGLAGQRLLRAQDGLSAGGDIQRLLGSEIAGKIGRIISQYSGLIEMLGSAPTVLHSLLGGDEPKRYLILGQSSDEVRPAGGFTSSVWVMNLDDGVLSNVEYINVLTFGEKDALGQIPNPPDELLTFMDAGAWYLRDVGWSPDFRSVAETTILMNAVTEQEPIDGVISLTQWAFVYLVDGLGSIETLNGELTGSQVMKVIEKGTDTEGTDFLLSMFDSMIDSITAERLDGNLVNFTQSILQAFAQKQVMVYSTDNELEEQLVKIGWGGSFGLSKGDVLGVFDSNIGWNKVGRNIERSVEYRLVLDSNGGGISNLTITHQNNSDGDENDCDAQVQPRAGENAYELLKDGCYWNLMRVYLPVATEVVELPNLPAPEFSVAVRTGHISAGANTSDVGWDDSGQYIRGLVVVPPGSARKTVFEYELPAGTADVNADALEYVLKVPIQAGIPNSSLLVEISVPDGYSIVDSNIESESTDPSVFRVNQVLASDFELRVVATKAK